jgi:transposase
MQAPFRPRRDFRGLEARRREAARRFRRGDSQALVARGLHVSRQSVSRWYRQWHDQGETALRAAGRAGRKPRLSAEQLAQVEAALQRGAGAHGFATELWTLPRVARMIARETGVRYHPGHVWRILHALHWTLQRPARRAAERDEAAIGRWVSQRWPAVKKTPDGATPG